MAKFKKNQVLAQIADSLKGKEPETKVEVLGHSYSLRLLKPEAQDWVASMTAGQTFAAVLNNARKPTLACALFSIDDTPIEVLFQPDEDMKLDMREFLSANADAMRDWRREAVLAFLSEDLNTYVVDALYSAYSKLAGEHREAMQNLENFSKRTPLPA